MSKWGSFKERIDDLVWAVWARVPFTIREWIKPSTWYYEARYFIQRGRRGWSDRDVWSLDHYLAKVIAGSVAHLQKSPTKGIPLVTFDDSACSATHIIFGTTSPEWEAADIRWESTLAYISKYFRIYAEWDDIEMRIWDYYRKHLPVLEIRDWNNATDEEQAANKKAIAALMKVNRVRERQRIKAFQLLAQYFPGLWD